MQLLGDNNNINSVAYILLCNPLLLWIAIEQVVLFLRQTDRIETLNCINSVLLLCGLLLYDAIMHMI